MFMIPACSGLPALAEHSMMVCLPLNVPEALLFPNQLDISICTIQVKIQSKEQ
jgi:hypothetical protein